jgi:TolA-binding protein
MRARWSAPGGATLLLLLSPRSLRCSSFLLQLEGAAPRSYSHRLPASPAGRWDTRRCRARTWRGKLASSSSSSTTSATALGLSLPSAAAAAAAAAASSSSSVSRVSSKYWLWNPTGTPSSSPGTAQLPSPVVWIELTREEAALQEQRRRLVRQIDDCEAALRKLRYDRVDYLVRQQTQQQQVQQQAWASLSASRKVGARPHGTLSSAAAAAKGRRWRNSEATDTVARSVVKALAWRVLAEAVTYAMALQWFHSASVASKFVAATCGLKLAAMVAWERAFARRTRRSASKALDAQQPVDKRPPHRSPVYPGSPSLSKDGVLRSLTKALSWRALAIAANVYLVLHMMKKSGAGAVGEATAAVVVIGNNGAVLMRVLHMEAFKAAILFVYERIWNRVDWGKIRGRSQGLTST